MDREPLAGRPMFVSPCNRQQANAAKLKVRPAGCGSISCHFN